jgi:putative NADPH-quinone reductase
MAKIAIIIGNAMLDSFSEALGQAYLRGAQAGGHDVTLIALARLQFDAVLREGYRREQPLEPDLVQARAALFGCDHIVLIFPLWCGDMPAILKGFIERVLQQDLLAIEASHGKKDRFILKGKSARIVMTMGMPALFYRWYFGAHALKLLKRNILQFTGVKPVRTTLYGMIEAVGDAKRKQWLRDMEMLGRAAG